MNDVKKCVKAMTVYCLLLAFAIFPNMEIIPLSFPTTRMSSIYLITLSICLILRYYLRAAGQTHLKTAMLHLYYMIFFMILLRGIKYSVFENVPVLGRYTWYLYYIPMIFIPTLLFFVSLYVYAKDEQQAKRKWNWVAFVSILLVILVLTNDLHGQVFRFHPGFADWDNDYSYAWGFYVVTVWEYLLYMTAITILAAKSSITQIRHHSWILLVSFAIGLALMLLSITGKMPKLNGNDLIYFPEAFCFMAAAVLECCMQLGLIPTNESYPGLIRITSVPVQITDRDGHVIYKSETARELTAEQISFPDNTRIGEHTVLRRMDIPGGFGFWQNDVSELDNLNEELEETKELLAEETELIRLQNEMVEKQKTIEHRTHVYDEIARRVRRRFEDISRIAGQAVKTSDPNLKERYRKQITMLGAFIKRYANLMLLASESETINAGELALSVSEVLRYLNLYGVPGELMNTASGTIPAKKALAAFDAFGTLIEDNRSSLKGVYANLSETEEGIVFKLTLENMLTGDPAAIRERLTASGVQIKLEEEDTAGYFRFLLSEGGNDR